MKRLLKSLVVALLTLEARLLLKRTKPTIIAVTGSVGKTSTKDAIYHALKGKVRARKSEKSYNSEIGVPLSVLGLGNAWSHPLLWLRNIIDGLFTALLPGSYPEVLVLEMGVDRPGDMRRLSAWVKPQIVVLTRLPDVPVHVEYFASPEAVIAEKLALVEALSSDGALVYNHDDENARRIAGSIPNRAIGYGRYSEAEFAARGDEVIYEDGRPQGLAFSIASPKGEADFSLRGAVGAGHLYHFAAAAAIGDLFGMSVAEVASALQDFAPPPGRMRLVDGLKDTVIIDDTYNSSPVALERALATLKELKGFTRKVAVLGDMLELGRFSISEHERCGALAADCADLLITVGVRSRRLAAGALAAGLSEKHILQYDDREAAGRELQTLIRPGDLILIKGSQSMRMERLVEEIMLRPEAAPELLVRQSLAWQAR